MAASTTLFGSPTHSPAERKYPDKLTITPRDLKLVIDEYNQNKTVTCLNPISSFITNLQKLYDQHSKDNSCLTAIEIFNLVKQLHVYNFQKNSPLTYSALEKCEQMNKLLRIDKAFRYLPPSFFTSDYLTQFLNNPSILNNLEKIVSSYKGIFRLSGLDLNPNSLRVIAEKIQNGITSNRVFNKTIYPHLSNDPFLVDACAAADLLEKMNTVIYHNSKTEENGVRNVPIFDTDISPQFSWHTPKLVGSEVVSNYKTVNTSINQQYKGVLNSQTNFDFIWKHREHSGVISQILIDLHQAVIGLDAQNKAEECIRQIGESKESNPKQEFQSISKAFHLLKINKLLNAANANYIVTLCDEKCRPFAEQMAKAAVDFHAQNKLDSNAWNIIKRNPANAPFISQILGMLEQAALTDLKNSVYLQSDQITESVAAVFSKLHNANPPLLSRDNVNLLLGKMHLADIILRTLPEEVTQQTFNNAIWVAEESEKVASGAQPLRLKA